MDELEILEYVNKNSKYVSVNKEKIIPFLNSIENVKYHYCWKRIYRLRSIILCYTKRNKA